MTTQISTNNMQANVVSQLCKAWVNFNGTGTVAIRQAYNVSSVTDGGVGVYTLNFTTALTDTDYVVTGVANGQNAFVDIGAIRTGTRTTSSIQIGVVNGEVTAFVDTNAVQIAIFR